MALADCQYTFMHIPKVSVYVCTNEYTCKFCMSMLGDGYVYVYARMCTHKSGLISIFNVIYMNHGIRFRNGI